MNLHAPLIHHPSNLPIHLPADQVPLVVPSPPLLAVLNVDQESIEVEVNLNRFLCIHAKKPLED